uniref:Uncharacterized protein n=1 Tax=Anguilla anguilla TaxID=7936 RepID=A0A0E9PJD6_ANGAN
MLPQANTHINNLQCTAEENFINRYNSGCHRNKAIWYGLHYNSKISQIK